MPEAKRLQCPSCGSSLEITGNETRIKCPYCGTVSMVPPELRNPGAPQSQIVVNLPIPPEALARMSERAQEQAARGGANSSRSRSNPFGAVIAGIIVLLVCAAIGAVNSDQLASVIQPEPTVAPVSRALASALPRAVTFASLKYEVTKAAITNEIPNPSKSGPKYSAKQAYARIELSATNLSNTKSVTPELDLITLQTGDGKKYQQYTSWAPSVEPQSSQDGTLLFAVPIDAKWDGAKLLFNEPGKEPAVLPLDGAVPAATYPIALKVSGSATVNQIEYQVLSGTLDLDADGERAETGKRYLRLAMQFINHSDFAGGFPLVPSDFRLIVNGAGQAPYDSPIQVLDALTTLNGNVTFVVPANATSAQLQVGEVGKPGTQTIAIPLNGK